MPKVKTNSGAAKRFKLTKSGKVKYAHNYKNHKLNGQKKSRKRKRSLRQGAYLGPTNVAAAKRLLPYM